MNTSKEWVLLATRLEFYYIIDRVASSCTLEYLCLNRRKCGVTKAWIQEALAKDSEGAFFEKLPHRKTTTASIVSAAADLHHIQGPCQNFIVSKASGSR